MWDQKRTVTGAGRNSLGALRNGEGKSSSSKRFLTEPEERKGELESITIEESVKRPGETGNTEEMSRTATTWS